ncbi:MAG: amidase [Candidatus Rokubacteria bacterium]|nr:amidase [Candidatus Rokubacteria bacterium]
MTDLCFTPAMELHALYRRRKVSPLEVTRAVLAQIERVNPQLNAYCTVAADQALRAARAATSALGRGRTLPPLHGVPVSIKDLTPTKGIRTTWGSKIYEHHVPEADALIVARLKAAGAIVIGKTNTPEFGAGANTFNAVFGATRNPWNPTLTCGGSTGGGGVALATGMGPLAQGSDLGGSLRLPAAFCGVVGLRPSPGLVPAWPTDLAWDTYSVQGPMARTVGDLALMLSAIAGADPRAPISYAVDPRTLTAAVKRPGVKGLRIAWSPDLGITPVDAEVERVVTEAIGVWRRLGARVERAHPDFADLLEIVQVSRGARMAAVHAERLEKHRAVMQENLVKNIEYGLTLTAAQIGRAERLRTALLHRVRTFFERFDLIVTPTAAVPPFPVETAYPTEINGTPMENYIQWVLLTYAFTVVGAPAMSIPCGFTRDGLPVGMQVAGRWRDEPTVLRAAAAFEAAQPRADKRPPVEGGGPQWPPHPQRAGAPRGPRGAPRYRASSGD